MKKFLTFILLSVLVLFGVDQSLMADSTPLMRLVNPNINRFTYDKDQNGNNIILDLTFRFYNVPTENSYLITIEQVDSGGNFLRFVYQKDIYSDIYDTDKFDLTYNMANIVYYDDIAFYRVRHGDDIIYSGTMAKSPNYYNPSYSSDNLYLDGYVYDLYSSPSLTDHNQSDFTYSYSDNFMILHYRLSNTIAPTSYGDLFIKFHNLNNLVVSKSLDYRYIIDAQLNTMSSTLNDEHTNNQYIIIPFRDEVPEFLITDDDTINGYYDNIVSKLDQGIYSISVTDDLDNFKFNALRPIAILEESNTVPFLIDAYLPEYSINETVTINFIKNSSEIANSYQTYSAYESSNILTTFDANVIDEKDRTVSISYNVDEDNVELGQNIKLQWFLEPKQVPYPVVMDLTFFNFVVSGSYDITDEGQVDDSINSILDVFNLNDTAGYILIMVLTFIIVNVIGVKSTDNAFILIIINLFVLSLFILIGWIPLWVSVLLGVVLLIGFIMSFKRGGSA